MAGIWFCAKIKLKSEIPIERDWGHSELLEAASRAIQELRLRRKGSFQHGLNVSGPLLEHTIAIWVRLVMRRLLDTHKVEVFTAPCRLWLGNQVKRRGHLAERPREGGWRMVLRKDKVEIGNSG